MSSPVDDNVFLRGEVGSPTSPRVACKRVVSLLIAIHVTAIATAVTGLPSGNFYPPYLCEKANTAFRPYLGLVFLENPYRFFAPNPGPSPLVWARVAYDDGSARWVEVPQDGRGMPPMVFQRSLSLPRCSVETMPLSDAPHRQSLTPTAAICLASYVRYLARTCSSVRSDGLPRLIDQIEVYRVDHFCLLPDQVRAGWDPLDLRSYQATYLGRFDVNGRRRDGKVVVPLGMDELAASILGREVVEAAGVYESGTPPMTEQRGVPRAIRQLVARFPELRQISPDQLVSRIQSLIPVESHAGVMAVEEDSVAESWLGRPQTRQWSDLGESTGLHKESDR